MNRTMYELAATSPNGQKYLAGYVRIPSLAGAYRMLRQHGQSWARLAGTDRCTEEGNGRQMWRLHLGQWTIQYSGRTMLEARRAPLPWFKDLV